MLMVSHDQNSDAAPHFNCLDLPNVMVPFMTPLTSCDATLVPMASHYQKGHVAPHVDCLE